MKKKIGIIIDDDFSNQHRPPYPHPTFFSYETPLRISSIINYFDKMNLFNDERILKLTPKLIDEEIIKLAHSQFYIDTIKRLSKSGLGILGDDIFITEDTYSLAKKAVGGVIESIESVLNKKVNQSFALVRPPGHHALREKAAGLCIFNNIANAILYFRQKKNYKEKIAIIDIDDHYGDGIARYFYDDPSVLYFSVHEYDFIEGDIGFISELGEGNGLGTNINFPIPMNISDKNFLEFIDILESILTEFNPDLIIVALGFDMYFADQIGNCFLTSKSYYDFSKKILRISENLCNGKLVFVLEGGYSIMGLPICAYAVIRALLRQDHYQVKFEKIDFSQYNKKHEILKIKKALINRLKNYWKLT